MKTITSGTLFLLALSFLLVVSCSPGKMMEGEERQIAGGSTPDWITEPEDASTDEERCFVGQSRNWSMEADARNDAEKDAYMKAAKGLGVYVRTKLNEVVSSVDMGANILTPAVVTDQLNQLESAGITRGRIDEYHIEKWMKMVDNELQYFYKAYVRYMVPRDYAKEVMADILKKQKDELQAEKERKLIDRALQKMEEMTTDDF